MNWLNKKFPPDTRYHSAIVKGENVLSTEGIKVRQQQLLTNRPLEEKMLTHLKTLKSYVA